MAKKKQKIRLLFRDGFFSTILSLLACYLLSLVFFNTAFFGPISKALQDFSFLDVYYAERLDQRQTIDTNIVLVNVEHKTRRELVGILQKAQDSKAKVVGFDIVLNEFEKTAVDTLLARLLNRQNVVSTYIINPDSLNILSHPFFRGDGVSGFANFSFDPNHAVVREFNGVHNYKGNLEKEFDGQLRDQLKENVQEDLENELEEELKTNRR